MWLLLLACTGTKPAPADDSAPVDSPADTSTDSGDDTAAAAPVLYVSSYFDGSVHRYDPTTGASLGTIAPVPGAQTVVLHEGRLVLVAEQANSVLLADPETGALIGTLIADDPDTEADETGGLSGPTAAIPGPDGLWYVASFNTDSVLRYTAAGAYQDTWVAAGADGLDGPDIGMCFNAAGELLVPGYYSNALHVFGPDGTPGPQLLTAADGLSTPRGVVAHADGRVWVTSWDQGRVLVRDADGVVSEAAALRRPTGLVAWGAELLVGSDASNGVLALDAETGEKLGARVEDSTLDGVSAVAVW